MWARVMADHVHMPFGDSAACRVEVRDPLGVENGDTDLAL